MGFEVNDLKDVLQPWVHVDEYRSKLGRDDKNCVVSFAIDDPVAAADLPAGIAVNLLLMLFLPVETWVRLALWLALGLAIYFVYGQRHSQLGKELRAESTSAS